MTVLYRMYHKHGLNAFDLRIFYLLIDKFWVTTGFISFPYSVLKYLFKYKNSATLPTCTIYFCYSVELKYIQGKSVYKLQSFKSLSYLAYKFFRKLRISFVFHWMIANLN